MDLKPHLERLGTIKEEKWPAGVFTKTCITWVIEDFESHSYEGENHRSPMFYSGPNKEYSWALDIFLDKFHRTDYIDIRVVFLDENQHENTNFVAVCSVLDKDGKKNLPQLVEVKNDSGLIRNFMDADNVLELLLPNGELRIVCEILDSTDVYEGQSSGNTQLKVFKKLFDRKKYCDFKFILKDKEFPVHRAVLGPQSPVFEAMFENNMRESTEGKVDIEDIEPHVMEKLLRFLYIGEIVFENSADLILVAAEKYQLESLKLQCENELAKGLSVDNIYDVLLLADQNNASNLKKKAMEYFDANIKKLVTTNDFKTSMNSFSKELLTEIIATYAMNR